MSSYKKNVKKIEEKGKIMLETLLEREFKQYMGIIRLTYYFQNDTPRKGLELKHYRYALVQKDDLKRDKKALYNFFERQKKPNKENHLKDNLTAVKYRMMCESKEIEKCISSRQNLSKNYLKNLLDAGYLIKDSEGSKTPRYYINSEKEKEIDIVIRKYNLKKWIINKIDDSDENNFPTLEKDLLKILFSKKFLKKK